MSEIIIFPYLETILKHFIHAIFLGFVPILIITFFAWVILNFTKVYEAKSGEEKVQRRFTKEEKTFASAFASLGALVGLFLGASRVGVVGAILPALITFVAGYLAYLFTHDSKIVNRHIVPACILTLIFSASTGAFYGSSIRGLKEENQRVWDKATMHYEKVELPLQYNRLAAEQKTILERIYGDKAQKRAASSDTRPQN